MTSRVRSSLTLRLTLLFASVSTSVLLLLGWVVAALVDDHFADLDRVQLHSTQTRIARWLETAPLPALAPTLDEFAQDTPGLALRLMQADGTVIAEAGPPAFATAIDALPALTAQPIRWRLASGAQYRGVIVQTPSDALGVMSLAVALDLAHHEHFMQAFQRTLWTFVGLAASASGLLGWWVVQRGLAPLRRIRHDAADITAHRLNRRLSATALPAELADVVMSLNAMLERLQASFERLSAFSADLAHELRTPVSAALTQTQVTLSRPRTAAEYESALASNAEELERLSKMIGDMLFLAKADHDLVVPARSPIDLRALCEELLDFYDALAEERGIHVHLNGNAHTTGDPLMIRRAAANVLSNAFDHTPEGGDIYVDVEQTQDGDAILRIANTGPTIAAVHLPRLFDRFYRADPSRQRRSDGVGLGLSITRSIMRAHGGEAEVQSEDGTTTFWLKMTTAMPTLRTHNDQ